MPANVSIAAAGGTLSAFNRGALGETAPRAIAAGAALAEVLDGRGDMVDAVAITAVRATGVVLNE